ncbi:hypothetical protein GDO81_018356 [Engystomops pustulosus]|uniref:peptidyl-tRNA hydrolase n=1 Tax=Engystomops pustulosus TaxID=76066 RepID=A0AAV7ABC1_ENGPU|nr:hypothetical protein GDO81_018356 [Engystomops pustulosus]KAG8557177.1 hypothetical protein GDO81_018356 [Engystomops pustulosus]
MNAAEQEASDVTQEAPEVNPQYLQQLKDLDIPEEEAKKALILTGNVSAEEAAIFYFDSLENQNPIAAQVGHGAVGLYQLMLRNSKTKEVADKWEEYGAKKIVLQGSSTSHLLELQALAISLDLPTYLVQDAGRTQIAAGSRTVLAIMGEEEMVNKVTGKLKLLN